MIARNDPRRLAFRFALIRDQWVDVSVLIVLIMFLAFATRASAQAGISGRVLASETRAPIAGAVVVVQGQTSGATTDSTGRFSLRGLKGGIVVVITRAVGFRP